MVYRVTEPVPELGLMPGDFIVKQPDGKVRMIREYTKPWVLETYLSGPGFDSVGSLPPAKPSLTLTETEQPRRGRRSKAQKLAVVR